MDPSIATYTIDAQSIEDLGLPSTLTKAQSVTADELGSFIVSDPLVDGLVCSVDALPATNHQISLSIECGSQQVTNKVVGTPLPAGPTGGANGTTTVAQLTRHG